MSQKTIQRKQATRQLAARRGKAHLPILVLDISAISSLQNRRSGNSCRAGGSVSARRPGGRIATTGVETKHAAGAIRRSTHSRQKTVFSRNRGHVRGPRGRQGSSGTLPCRRRLITGVGSAAARSYIPGRDIRTNWGPVLPTRPPRRLRRIVERCWQCLGERAEESRREISGNICG